ncbi:uncharacterized protein LOC128326851 [Hemicordylus capensis]|uniref:uncharacterized protein LOC128326851 n=1 Tax=Hemicordylus capensis TaxID=884348 RepID=UPI002303AD7D|nr:uncharacterized protein LOC128326851 [Hemicordylus capensis]
MPKRRSVLPLQRLCLENVAEHMQPIWAKDYTDRYLDEYHFRFLMGPFSELAGCLVQELLQLMGKSRRLTRAMLHLLLVPHLTELSLRTCPKLVSQAIARIITVRCKNLSFLDLQGCSRVPTTALVDLLEGLPCLTKLDLSETQCDTHVLSAVGSCCRRLRELDISECKRLSPASLLHLAYDPTVGSFCCPMLRVLSVDGLEPGAHSQDLVLALAFLLLALPSLKLLAHDLVAKAVCLIHNQQFSSARVAPGFPSLEELVRCRPATPGAEEGSGLKLPLEQISVVWEPFMPTLCAVCPHLVEVTVFLGDGPGLGQAFLSWKHLAHLTVNCTERRDLRELLPVVGSLGPQLQSLSLGGFSLEDELSFHTLLGQCPGLRNFSASLFSPVGRGLNRGEPEAEDWGLWLTVPEFSQLRTFSLLLSGIDQPLPSRHTAVLRASLRSLLRHSPCLESLDLVALPFSLDGVLQEVLEPPGTALARLRELSLAQGKVSSPTIHRLLSSDNQLSYLNLDGCPDITQRDYDKLLGRVSREGLELHIVWA